MTRSEVKPKSIRKALRDVSNNNDGGRSSRFASTATKKCTVKDKENKTLAEQDEEEGEGKTLDRLMLVHSDLTLLIRQVTINCSWNSKDSLLSFIKPNSFPLCYCLDSWLVLKFLNISFAGLELLDIVSISDDQKLHFSITY